MSSSSSACNECRSKEEELERLQANFDEYIASSRELEEELDAEITLLHSKMAESSAANVSLADQLASVMPQIESLESSIQSYTMDLKRVNEARLQAEQQCEEFSQKCRQMDMTMEQLREAENQATEELALQQGELEDMREEFECQIEKYREELEDLRNDNAVLKTKLSAALEEHKKQLNNDTTIIHGDGHQTPSSAKSVNSDDETVHTNHTSPEKKPHKDLSASENIIKVDLIQTEDSNDEENLLYIKSLEDELEVVSEQLIDAQSQLNEVTAELEAVLIDREESERLIMELSEKVELLENQSNTKDLDNEERIRLSSQIEHMEEDALTLTEELDLAHEELGQVQQQLENLENECKSLKESKASKDTKIHHLTTQMKALENRLKEQGLESLEPIMNWATIATMEQSEAVMFRDDLEEEVSNAVASRDVQVVSKLLQQVAKKSKSQQQYNAQLLNKILKLQGNIQVCCRIRPLSDKELKEDSNLMVEPLSETELACYDSRGRSWKSFAFDRVWGSDHGQASVFQDVEPLALSVVDGYNSCIFAYGQTGSGKTYTMEGVNGDGISHRTLVKMFSLLSQKVANHMTGDDESGIKSQPFSFSVNVGMLEVYNDEIYDLLAAECDLSSKSTLDVRRSTAGYMEVPDLTKERVTCPQDVADLLNRGNAKRATATTNMNEHSSRSHMVLHIEVHTSINGHDQPVGNLYLVDLAGSERVSKSGVEGAEMKEAQHINKSLSALGDVMAALDEKKSHIPFRNSKLTYLLQDSLGGNSRTMMVVTVCPSSDSLDESMCTLQFATRVRRINLGSAQKNVSNKNLEESLKNATKEMRQLESAKLRTEEQLLALRRDHQRIQERLQNSQEMRSQNKDESRTIATLRKTNEDLTSRLQKEKEMRHEKVTDLDNCQQELRRIQKQLLNATRDRDNMSKRMIDYEKDMKDLRVELREAKDQASAATIRARKSNIINSARSTLKTSPIDSVSPSNRSGIPRPMSTRGAKTPSSVASTPSSKMNLSENTQSVRNKIKGILEKYDPTKVEKIDELMERFKGKEERLLEKMRSRYISSPSSSRSPTPDNVSPAVKKRAELAMARHAERMRKIRSPS